MVLTLNRSNMNRLKIIPAVLVLSLLAALHATSSAKADTAAQWRLDPVHSNASFAVAHLGISEVHGNFTRLEGTLSYDGKSVAAASVSATIDVSSVDTRNANRDQDLRSPNFFDAAKFPTMTFKSKRFRVMSGGKFQVVGDLTIHGVTRTVVLDGKGPSQVIKDPWGHFRVGASLSTDINRKDFGLTYNKVIEAGGLVVGENVHITIDAEFVKAQ